MGFFNFGTRPKPKDVAKDRLRLILIHDRGDIPAETVEKIREEILAVLSKYIEIDAEDVEIAVTKSDMLEGEGSPALSCNIPIRGVRGR